MDNHACQDCSWFHDFGTHGYCNNKKVRLNELNRVEFDEFIENNNCEHFDDDIWFGG